MRLEPHPVSLKFDPDSTVGIIFSARDSSEVTRMQSKLQICSISLIPNLLYLKLYLKLHNIVNLI